MITAKERNSLFRKALNVQTKECWWGGGGGETLLLIHPHSTQAHAQHSHSYLHTSIKKPFSLERRVYEMKEKKRITTQKPNAT